MYRSVFVVVTLASACLTYRPAPPASRFDTFVRDTTAAVVLSDASQAFIRFPTPRLEKWVLTGPPARRDDTRPRYWWELWLYYSDRLPLGIYVTVPSGLSTSIRTATLVELISHARVATLEGTSGIGAIVTPLPGVRAVVREGAVEVLLTDTAVVRQLFSHPIREARLTFVDRDTSSHNVQVYVPVLRHP